MSSRSFAPSRNRLWTETLTVLAVAAVPSALAVQNDWYERLCMSLMRWERAEIDEYLIVLVIYAAAFTILFIRRGWQLRAQLRRSAEQERHAWVTARRDHLTGLDNRLCFAEFVDQLEDAEAETVAFLMIDLDGFKQVNDRLGHRAGDELLRMVAARLRAVVAAEEGAMLARLGGDEFGCVIRADDRRAAERLAARIADAVGQPFALAGRTVAITASVGVSRPQSCRVDPDELMSQADLDMYRAKRARSLVSVG